MTVWAIADPHLSLNTDKPMDVFGTRWDRHQERLETAWRDLVSPDDVVLLPGDISWAMTLEEAEPDLAFIHSLPGTKLISRGNHDYWWTSLRKMETLCAEKGYHSLLFMRNQAFRVGQPDQGPNLVICGTRGWINPNDSAYQVSKDEKIYLREVGRLRMSLDSAKAVMNDESTLVVAFHYPPINRQADDNGFIDLLQEYKVDICLYGHVHGLPGSRCPEGEIDGVLYHNVASDHLDFVPKAIWEGEGQLLEGFPGQSA